MMLVLIYGCHQTQLPMRILCQKNQSAPFPGK